MPTPTVTWIMPVRNAERTLDAALDAIAAQDYPKHELLAWDDGSTDASPDILKRRVGKDFPGRVVGHERVGTGRALALLAGSATHELLARADADTLSRPDRLTQQAGFLVEHQKFGALGTQLDTADGRTPPQPTHDADTRWALRFENPIHHATVMLRRSAVLEVGNYRDARPGEDYDLWVRMALTCRVGNLPEALVENNPASTRRTDTPTGEAFYRLRDARVDRLLPGTEPGAAVRLLNLVRADNQEPVTEDDLRRFRRSAMLAAQACRYRPSYFMQTQRFKDQVRLLQDRYLRTKPVVRACRPLLRSAKSLADKLHHKRPGQAA